MIKQLEYTLKDKQIRPTAMRLLVLETLQKQKAAVSLLDLEAAFERADRITLFRTLKTFEEKGLIHRIEDGSGSAKFALCADACKEGHHHDLHVHFFCNRCQETYCLPKSKIPDISLPHSFKPEEVQLLVKGICGSCSA